MGSPIRRQVPYPRPVLKLLDRENVTYKIIAATWAAGKKNCFDFKSSRRACTPPTQELAVGPRRTASFHVSSHWAGDVLAAVVVAE